MNLIDKQTVRIAILDLYEGATNQGMRGIREIIKQFGEINQLNIELQEFDVRLQHSVPDLSYDIYISSGGPGSPLESEGSEWEKKYFEWLSDVEKWNDDAMQLQKKYVFFICHSFQLVCRHWQLATVCARKSTSFGVFPIHLLEEGKEEPVFNGMADPFYAVDSRDYQVIEPRMNILYKGAKILCIEKDRPHLPYERAIMGIRFSDYFIGTQFHPEADAVGMSMYLQTEEKKKTVIENHGEQKWKSMIEQLNDPEKILWTYAHILPNFLNIALNSFSLVPA
ncbi:GMP synthase [Ginsengibacter hankyongi]|uniref:GMP synthase n=1 Tax=Ginsengibacter hankyongi TaxID=2607284 RepID=A0A5J5IEJ4_9BACT|nr:GMP synthase [Ginsengibacter hankyongi]KAA9037268.1 GMP synthase [Ginsengibacter hankyongi]